MKCDDLRSDAALRHTILLAGNSNSIMDPRGHPNNDVNTQDRAGHISMSIECIVRNETVERRMDRPHRVPPDRMAERFRARSPQPAEENYREPNGYHKSSDANVRQHTRPVLREPRQSYARPDTPDPKQKRAFLKICGHLRYYKIIISICGYERQPKGRAQYLRNLL